MKVILMKDVPDLGFTGDIVQVKDGYGRNYLIPKGFAILATERNEKVLSHQKRMVSERMLRLKKDAEEVAQRIESTRCTILRKAGEKEKLFGSVTSQDVHQTLLEKGIEVDRRRIILNEPIKSLGEHVIPVKLHPEVVANLKLTVKSE